MDGYGLCRFGPDREDGVLGVPVWSQVTKASDGDEMSLCPPMQNDVPQIDFFIA